MPPFLQLAIALTVIIAAAKAGGYISSTRGQPSVLGELLVGLILGPSVLNFMEAPLFDESLTETITQMAELGVLLLMFIAGLDLHISELARSGKVALLAGSLGVLVPVAMGYGVGQLFSMPVVPAIFVGLILAATSVSISAQTLMELRVLRSRVGISLLGAAVFDDILVVLALSVLVAVTTDAGAGLASAGIILLRMVSYLVVAYLAGVWLLPRLANRIDSLPISRGLVAFAFVTMLLYAWAAEIWGHMAPITGAFVAGLVFARSPLRDRIEAEVATLAYGLFVPIFFINVGLSANARELSGSVALVLSMIIVAVISKVVGAGLGGRLGGLTGRESLQLGVGMMSRGEVGLIVATLGINQGIIGQEIFAAVVGMVIVTTLLTPPALHRLFAGQTAVRPQPQEAT